jgi:Prokaryotic phospholipase A2
LGMAVCAALVMLVTLAAPAGAVDQQQRLAVMDSWSQTTGASRDSWLAANADQGAWADYAFDWSTDLCSYSPDNPFGFAFELSCARHDFGYRNYKLAGIFPANKDRIDDAFYADLTNVCDHESSWAQPPCYGLAWTYYQAVKEFGSLTAVKQSDLDRAERQLADARRAAAAR